MRLRAKRKKKKPALVPKPGSTATKTSSVVARAAKAERLARILDCVIRGIATPTKIREAIGGTVSLSQISSDLREIEKDFISRSQESIDAIKGRVFARMEYAYQEAAWAWNKSCERVIEREVEVTQEDGTTKVEKVETKTREPGNARYLDAMVKTILDMAKVTGITSSTVNLNAQQINIGGETQNIVQQALANPDYLAWLETQAAEQDASKALPAPDVWVEPVTDAETIPDAT